MSMTGGCGVGPPCGERRTDVGIGCAAVCDALAGSTIGLGFGSECMAVAGTVPAALPDMW